MSESSTAWLQMHLCVLLWGFTAILGRMITLPALPLVMWRMLIVAVALLLLPRVWRGLQELSVRHLLAFCGVGILVALHWITFYGAVKMANASVAASCMALLPVFMCILEPIITGKRFLPRELLLGVLVIPGVSLVVGGTPDAMEAGIALGILSAALAAVFSAFNKRLVYRTDALSATALEMLSGGVFLLVIAVVLAVMPPVLPRVSALLPVREALFAIPELRDLLLLAGLAFACTLLPFALSLHALRQLSAYASALVVNLEPVYAIVLAILILDEQRELTLNFYLGAAIMLAVVFIYPLLVNQRRTQVVPK